VPAGGLDEKLGELVAALLAKPPEALRLTQGLLRHGATEEILERMKMESTLFAERLQSTEVKEAITAFFEKRKPRY
jgi:enoyl-CoA hydratase/carnithine racemase